MGALCTVKTRLLHPNATVRAKVIGVDIPFHHETTTLRIIRREEQRIRQKNQMCYILNHASYIHDDGSPVVLYAVCRNCKIEEEGPPGEYFVEVPTIVAGPEQQEQEGEALPPEVLTILPGDDISSLIRQGITIDDDNNPAPENEDRTTTTNDNMYGEWGFRWFSSLCLQT
jgi:hypothetical protein